MILFRNHPEGYRLYSYYQSNEKPDKIKEKWNGGLKKIINIIGEERTIANPIIAIIVALRP